MAARRQHAGAHRQGQAIVLRLAWTRRAPATGFYVSLCAGFPARHKDHRHRLLGNRHADGIESAIGDHMITCYLRYIIDPYKLKEFEAYGKLWIPLVERFGGQHHGYFLPSEGASNVALAMFSFPSLALYEQYRTDSLQDADCQAAFRYAEETRCIVSYERSFFRPVFA